MARQEEVLNEQETSTNGPFKITVTEGAACRGKSGIAPARLRKPVARALKRTWLQ